MPPRKRNPNAHLESAEQILREAQVLRTRLATQLAAPQIVPLFVPHRPLEALPELAEAEGPERGQPAEPVQIAGVHKAIRHPR